MNVNAIEIIKPMQIAKGLSMKILIFYDENVNNFHKILNPWNQNGGLPKLLQTTWNLSGTPIIHIDDDNEDKTVQVDKVPLPTKSQHSLRTKKEENFEDAVERKRGSVSASVSSFLRNLPNKTEEEEHTFIEHSESRILHTAELMKVGTSEYIKDFIAVKPDKGHQITSSVLGDLRRDSSSETDRDSETEEESQVDVQIEKLMDALKKKHRDGNAEGMEVSITIQTHHEHMVGYDDVISAIEEMNKAHGIADHGSDINGDDELYKE